MNSKNFDTVYKDVLMTQDIKGFRNRLAYWEHYGSFSIELADNANMSILPSTDRVEGHTIYVERGLVKQAARDNIELYSTTGLFYWGSAWVKAIRGEQGNLLWVNPNQL